MPADGAIAEAAAGEHAQGPCARVPRETPATRSSKAYGQTGPCPFAARPPVVEVAAIDGSLPKAVRVLQGAAPVRQRVLPLAAVLAGAAEEAEDIDFDLREAAGI